MADPLKARVAARVMQRIREMQGDPTMDRTRCETALRRMGMKAGNAQRLLDDTSDVQLERLEQVARLLDVHPMYFLDSGEEATSRPAEPCGPSAVLNAIASLSRVELMQLSDMLNRIALHPEMRDDLMPGLQAVLASKSGKQRQAA